MPVRFVAAVLVVVAAGGCHRTSRPPTALPPTGTTVATGVGATTSLNPPETGTTVTATTALGTGCPTGALTAVLTSAGAAAGTAYSHLVFGNTSTRSCTMAGYPGVSFVDGSGHQIGAPVPREHRFPAKVTLLPDGSVGALFAYHDVFVATFAGCRPVMAAGIRVYPPNQTAALFVARSMLVCSNPATDGTASITEVTEPANLPGPG